MAIDFNKMKQKFQLLNRKGPSHGNRKASRKTGGAAAQAAASGGATGGSEGAGEGARESVGSAPRILWEHPEASEFPQNVSEGHIFTYMRAYPQPLRFSNPDEPLSVRVPLPRITAIYTAVNGWWLINYNFTIEDWPLGLTIQLSEDMIPVAYAPLPDGGVTTGELLGHRMWRVINWGGNFYLRSLFDYAPRSKLIWPYDAPLEATKVPEHARGGIYAYRTVGEFERKEMKAIAADRVLADCSGIYAIGTVHMWGRVIVHDNGYRAEFARCASIEDIVRFHLPEADKMDDEDLLMELRKLYGVE